MAGEPLPPPIYQPTPCACMYGACWKVGRCLMALEPEQVETLMAIERDPTCPESS